MTYRLDRRDRKEQPSNRSESNTPELAFLLVRLKMEQQLAW
jgi:hypothetical protein